MNKRINKIGIVGEAFSGSTVLSLILGAHPDILNIGEMQEALFGLSSGEKRPLCSYCRGLGAECPFWTDSLIDELRQSEGPHSLLLEKTGKKVLVDSSKYRLMYDRMIGDGYDNWLFIHLAKSAEEQIASYKMRSPDRKAHMDFDEAKRHWLEEQAGILEWLEKMRTRGGSAICLRYYDFMTQTASIIKKILGYFNLEFNPEILDFWNAKQHFCAGNSYVVSNFPGLEKQDYIEGEDFNFKRYQPRRRSLFYDDKWKEVLTAGEYMDLQGDSRVRELWNKMQTQLDIKAGSGKEKENEREHL